jgi:hypothetical protein
MDTCLIGVLNTLKDGRRTLEQSLDDYDIQIQIHLENPRKTNFTLKKSIHLQNLETLVLLKYYSLRKQIFEFSLEQ